MLIAKFKGLVLGITSAIIVTTGIGVLAQGPGNDGLGPPGEDRIGALERKLDRILEALGGSNRTTNKREGDTRPPDTSVLPALAAQAPKPGAAPTATSALAAPAPTQVPPRLPCRYSPGRRPAPMLLRRPAYRHLRRPRRWVPPMVVRGRWPHGSEPWRSGSPRWNDDSARWNDGSSSYFGRWVAPWAEVGSRAG